jgi:hypothetical protein
MAQFNEERTRENSHNQIMNDTDNFNDFFVCFIIFVEIVQLFLVFAKYKARRNIENRGECRV